MTALPGDHSQDLSSDGLDDAREVAWDAIDRAEAATDRGRNGAAMAASTRRVIKMLRDIRRFEVSRQPKHFEACLAAEVELWEMFPWNPLFPDPGRHPLGDIDAAIRDQRAHLHRIERGTRQAWRERRGKLDQAANALRPIMHAHGRTLVPRRLPRRPACGGRRRPRSASSRSSSRSGDSGSSGDPEPGSLAPRGVWQHQTAGAAS